MHRILIIGSTGFVGQALVQHFVEKGNTVTGASRSIIREMPITNHVIEFTNFDSFDSEILNNIDIIINCAGLIGFSQCEKNKDLAYDINVNFVKKLLKKVYQINPNIKWIQLSTNAVIGKHTGKIKEATIKNPQSVYGITKSLAEDLVIDSPLENLIARTCDVYGNYAYLERKERFYSFVKESSTKNRKINFPRNIISNPIHVKDLCSAIDLLIAKKVEGIINIAGNKVLNRYQYAQEITNENGLKNHTFTSDPIEINKGMVENNVLDISLLESIGFKHKNSF